MSVSSLSMDYFEWDDLVTEVEKEANLIYGYPRNIRDWGNKFNRQAPDYNPESEYKDFWHWMINHFEISNGKMLHFEPFCYADETRYPSWVVEILNLFGRVMEESDTPDVTNVLISW